MQGSTNPTNVYAYNKEKKIDRSESPVSPSNCRCLLLRWVLWKKQKKTSIAVAEIYVKSAVIGVA